MKIQILFNPTIFSLPYNAHYLMINIKSLKEFYKKKAIMCHSGLQNTIPNYLMPLPFAWGMSVQKCVSTLVIRTLYLKSYHNVPVI